jgi:hypothetical protein
MTFIKDVASAQPPEHLSQLMRMLKTRGGWVVNCSTS